MLTESHGIESTLRLRSIDCDLALAAVYDKVQFPRRYDHTPNTTNPPTNVHNTLRVVAAIAMAASPAINRAVSQASHNVP